MKLIIFDVDGTIIDSLGIIHGAMWRAFERNDLDKPTRLQTKSIIGLTLNKAIATLMGCEVNDHVEKVTDDYRSIYAQLQQDESMQSVLYDGIEDVIRQLDGREDVLLALATGKSRKGMLHMVADHGFEDVFAVMRSADDCPSKPSPVMIDECCEVAGVPAECSVMIGDSGFDMAMAKAAGAKAIGVAWGYQEVKQLKATGGMAIAQIPSDLPGLIDQVLGDCA